MTTKVVPGTLKAVDNAAQAAVAAADRMVRAIEAAFEMRGEAFIALSGGTTPRAAYAELAKAPNVDWSRVHVFLVDERAGPADGERSNYRMIRETLLAPAGIPDANVVRPRSEAADLDAAAREYERAMTERLPLERGRRVFDLIVFGIGTDGHTASLFPGDPAVRVRDRLAVATKAAAGREARLTLTAPVLEAARSSVVIVVGADKHAALERVWAAVGDLDVTPARLLRGGTGVVWVIDHAAGGLSP